MNVYPIVKVVASAIGGMGVAQVITNVAYTTMPVHFGLAQKGLTYVGSVVLGQIVSNYAMDRIDDRLDEVHDKFTKMRKKQEDVTFEVVS